MSLFADLQNRSSQRQSHGVLTAIEVRRALLMVCLNIDLHLLDRARVDLIANDVAIIFQAIKRM